MSTKTKNPPVNPGVETQKVAPVSAGVSGLRSPSAPFSSPPVSKPNVPSASSPAVPATPAMPVAPTAATITPPQQLPPSQGTASADAKKFREELGLTVDEFAKLLGSSSRSVTGWESGQPMSPLAARVFLEVKALIDRLAALSNREEFPNWLKSQNRVFNSSPIQLIQSGQMYRLWELVFRIESGNPM